LSNRLLNTLGKLSKILIGDGSTLTGLLHARGDLFPGKRLLEEMGGRR
jgi:hypothetical protein